MSVLALVLGGCGVVDHREQILCNSLNGGVDIPHYALDMDDGEQVRLADLTDVTWDAVWSLPGSMGPEQMKDRMGVSDMGKIPSEWRWCTFGGLYFVEGDRLVGAANWNDRWSGISVGVEPQSWGSGALLVKQGAVALICEPHECGQ